MRVYRLLLPLLASFLLLSIGEPIQMIEQAIAKCLPWPRCCWQGIVAGTATVTDPKARITTKDLEKAGLFAEVDVSQEMLDAFKEEGLVGKPVSGFIILTGMKMTGFVPTTLLHKDEDKNIPPEKALKVYNEEFEKVVMGMQKGKS